MKRNPPLISRSAPELADSYNRTVAAVARERRYLATVDGFPPESSRDFIEHVVRHDLAQFFLVQDGEVLGWCDLIPKSIPEFAHTGVLGMGLLPEWRGKGWGRRLLEATLRHAAAINRLEKAELAVYQSNLAAVNLYRRLGFFEEGRRLKARKLDGHYENELLMGKFLD